MRTASKSRLCKSHAAPLKYLLHALRQTPLDTVMNQHGTLFAAPTTGRAGALIESKAGGNMAQDALQIWDLWIADVGPTGMPFARGRLNPTDVLLAHALPQQLNVVVMSDDGDVLARGNDLQRTASSPIARLRCEGKTITREDIWPTEADYGTPIILPGGEVGILQQWWNDPDHQEWRWIAEFYNHR